MFRPPHTDVRKQNIRDTSEVECSPVDRLQLWHQYRIVELTPHYDIQKKFLFWIAVDCVGALNKVAIGCILHLAFYFVRLLEPFGFQFFCHSQKKYIYIYILIMS